MPTIITAGAASAKGYGFGASAATAANYIEDVFSTYLYTGTASAQTITNGIDLSGKGGMVWLKSRSGADSHYIVDTARGSNKVIYSDLTISEETLTRFSSFNSNGFSLSTTPSNPNVNGYTYASWTFRKQAKFFDVVTYTGDGSASPRQIAHSLGSVPGFIVIKRTDTSSDWTVWHRSVTGNAFLQTSDAWQTGYTRITTPDASTFTVGASAAVNASGGTYVAYLFAHDAGGFGASGSDNVISCGSITTSASVSTTISLGYEPQWLLTKRIGTGDWFIVDNMRGWIANGDASWLVPNSTSSENYLGSFGVSLNSTGFTFSPLSGAPTYIYIAIRRGPMKTPTSGTSVFIPVTITSTSPNTTVTTNFAADMTMRALRDLETAKNTSARIIGGKVLRTNSTDAETAAVQYTFDSNNSVTNTGTSAGYSSVYWNFRRAPGFFDVVCYTGDGSAKTLNHNLGVTPELIINKNRSGTDDWYTTTASLTNPDTYVLTLNTTNSQGNTGVNFIYNRTASTFSVFSGLSNSGQNYVNYLFATCPGVSKVGSYTGSGTTKQIDCGFTNGARFVLIKRTDGAGGWYVWDTARGIVAGNDPYTFLNTIDMDFTGTDYIDTYSAGFEISSTAPAAINANGGSFIFLAIA